MENKHEGVRYSCDKCEYSATRLIHLKSQKEYIHEGQRFHCDKCEYSGTCRGNLRKHIESKHEGVINVSTQQLYQTILKDIKSLNTEISKLNFLQQVEVILENTLRSESSKISL